MLTEIHMQANESTRQTNVSFTALGFATLALSIQFSPSYGIEWPWILVASWPFFLISGLVGGRNLVERDTMHRLNVQKLNFDSSIRSDRAFLNQLQVKNASAETEFESQSGSKVTKKYVMERLAHHENEFRKADEAMDKFNNRSGFWFYFQTGSYIVGVVLNVIFVAYNYLHRALAI